MKFLELIKNKIPKTLLSPKTLRFGSIGYVTCASLYAGKNSYYDSKNLLTKFRVHEKKYSSGQQEHLLTMKHDYRDIKTEWDAVYIGAYTNFCSHLWYGIVWPVTMAVDIVPTIVLLLNPDTSIKEGECEIVQSENDVVPSENTFVIVA
jgi:hypothetical protein